MGPLYILGPGNTDYRVDSMADQDTDDGAPVGEAVEVSGDTGFPCSSCGADTRWDPDADAMHCDHCGTVVPVPRAEGLIVEHALEDAGDAARGLGVEVRVSECEECGARVTFGGTATSTQCVYCGSASVLDQIANRNAIRPESVIPLDVARGEVEEKFRKWIGGLWFRPNALKAIRRFDAAGVYVPFWTFDCQVHSDWSADAGHYYWVSESYTTTENGKTVTRTRMVRKIRWVPAWGQRDDAYDDLLVHASASQPRALVQKLGAFDMSDLVPYRPEYLAGWRSEEYQVDLEHGWEDGTRQVVASQESRCAGDIPGDTYRYLRVKNQISGVRWKHLLLPIWSLQYTHQKKVYTVLLHGQTGKVVGQAPYSWVKILALILGMVAAGLLIAAASGATGGGAIYF